MVRAVRTFRVAPSLPDALAPLAELAGNLRWAWDPETRELFRWADPGMWEESGGNPVALLGRLGSGRLAELAEDEAYQAAVAERHESLREALAQSRWAQRRASQPPRVAYFSPEFGISAVMPTYSGGLGVLAGDHLKAASDLGLPLVGVGLLYRFGYVRQHLDADGWQQEAYPDLNPHLLPLSRLEGRGGEPVTVEVDLAGSPVAVQVWVARVGRVPLLLLDTDVPGNAPGDRGVTDRLYGGDAEHRLRQELVLGIGGMRALRAAEAAGALEGLGGPPQVFHSNEGHAGFLGLERLRELVDAGCAVDTALEAVRAATLFTTHTPVAAGIDKFPRALVERYLERPAAEAGLDLDRLLAIGRLEGEEGEFNMAALGLRLSARANGVSELHGRVARRMFAGLWPDLDPDEVPIAALTNGVHAATWIGPEQRELYDRHLPPDWRRNPDAWAQAGQIPDETLWRARNRARERLVAEIRRRVRRQAQRRGERGGTLGWVDELLDPDALTIGFARRFAEYKRGALLLRQPERLRALLADPDRPVQLVFAGKAHPRDDAGKHIIREIVHLAAQPELRSRLVFVEDYDMALAAELYAGCDVWLNTPRRPLEACGTSGQKAVLNGALHCSVLDGWWDELYDGDNGFAIGGREAGEPGAAGEPGEPGGPPDREQQDAADAQALFDVLERSVVPRFYDRSESPLPRRWLATVRHSLATLARPVLAGTMVRRYTREHYEPLAARGERLAADGAAAAVRLAAWKQRVAAAWPQVAVTDVDADAGEARKGEQRRVAATVKLGELDPADVAVEALHGPVRADGEIESPRRLPLEPAGEDGGGLRAEGVVTCEVAGEYGVAVRARPHHDDLGDDLELGLAAWARPDHG